MDKIKEQKIATDRYRIRLSPRVVMQSLLFVTAILLSIHVVFTIIHYSFQELPWLLRQLFHVDEENNLPTWYSGFLLLATSTLLWFFALTQRANEEPWFRHWLVLAVGFLLMSIDEVAGIHETINSIIEISWAIPGGMLVLLLILAFVPFLLQLPRRTAKLFILAGTVYLTGAVVLEIIAIPMSDDTLTYDLLVAVEEGLEMLGVILFLHTLLTYMRSAKTKHVDVSIMIR
ncbi:MAG: hypothetical protein L3J01_01410 [Thiomicrorhabdus sp.]|nr:hypothetical protein [Thiomicrorhabdus sp.]